MSALRLATMAQGVTHAVGTSRPVIVASAPDGVDEMLIFFSSPARDGRAATQRRGERHDSQKTHLLILPKPGGIQSQPKGEINSNCTKIVNSRTHGRDGGVPRYRPYPSS